MYLETSPSDGVGLVDAAYDMKPLSLAGVDQVERIPGSNSINISHLHVLLHQLLLGNGRNCCLPCNTTQSQIFFST